MRDIILERLAYFRTGRELFAGTSSPRRASDDGGDDDGALLCCLQEEDYTATKLILCHSRSDCLVNKPCRSMGGKTALHLAAENDWPEICNELLLRGAKVNAEDNHGETPLMAAVENDHMEVARVLLEQGGADPNARGITYVCTPIAKAVTNNFEEIVELLLTHGADPNALGYDGETSLLHEAIHNGDDECVSLLVKHGATVQQVDGMGRNEDHDSIVEILLEKGMDPNTEDDDSNTPLQLAALTDNDETTRVLLDYGASPWKVNTPRMTLVLPPSQTKCPCSGYRGFE